MGYKYEESDVRPYHTRDPDHPHFGCQGAWDKFLNSCVREQEQAIAY